MKKLSICIVALMWVAFAPAAVPAATIEGVTFDKSCIEADQKLDLRGAGLFRWFLFKAYVGALYLPDEVASNEVLADVPKRLEISYFYAINGKDLGAATRSGIRKNVDAATFERLEPLIEQLNALYRNVQPGDRYALTYVPGKGTTLSLNGVDLGVVDGAEFASAVYAIWLGESPLSVQLKSDLLGGKG